LVGFFFFFFLVARVGFFFKRGARGGKTGTANDKEKKRKNAAPVINHLSRTKVFRKRKNNA